jgi:hypothetical protein
MSRIVGSGRARHILPRAEAIGRAIRLCEAWNSECPTEASGRAAKHHRFHHAGGLRRRNRFGVPHDWLGTVANMRLSDLRSLARHMEAAP